jgi:hypothetical protein
VDQPGVRWPEAAGIKVKRPQVSLEIHMQPLASGGLHVLSRESDSPRCDASALVATVRFGVDDEGVVSTIRNDVHEADELTVDVARSYPAKAVRPDSIPPADLGIPAMGGNEFNHLVVSQRVAPPVSDALGEALGLNGGRRQTVKDYP